MLTGHAAVVAEVPGGHHHGEDRKGADGREPAQRDVVPAGPGDGGAAGKDEAGGDSHAGDQCPAGGTR